MADPDPKLHAASQGLIEELMAAVVAVDFILRTLMELPAGALPGDDDGESVRRLLTASAHREVEAVGEEACRAATALISAVIGRMSDDTQAAAEMAGAVGQHPC